MDNSTNFVKTSPNKERELTDLQHISDFLKKADNITENSSTMDICKLIGEISDYEIYKASFFKNILAYLQKLLSNCIASKCNSTNLGFIKLHDYVTYQTDLLTKLHFI